MICEISFKFKFLFVCHKVYFWWATVENVEAM